MNPYALIGLILVLLYATKCANAMPVETHATNSTASADFNSTNVQANNGKLDNVVHNIVDTSKSAENIKQNQPLTEQTTQKHVVRLLCKRGNPRVCKRVDGQTTTRKPATQKPSKVSFMPTFFLSQGWGPGR